jgi:hypothetical protein
MAEETYDATFEMGDVTSSSLRVRSDFFPLNSTVSDAAGKDLDAIPLDLFLSTISGKLQHTNILVLHI